MKSVTLRFPARLHQVRLSQAIGEGICEPLAMDPAQNAANQVYDPVLEKVRKEEQEREAVQRVFQSIERTLPELRGLVESRLDEWASYVLELALRLAGEALGRELEAGNYDLVATIRDSLSHAVGVGSGQLTIYLNPQDLGLVLERMGNGKDDGAEGSVGRVEYQVDPTVPVGSCRIESNHCRIVQDPRTVLEGMVQKIRGELGA
ncbi:MAG TPA: hypothetical protein ENK02_06270 [Planctomycetes bacterium]|nr:hypothetical protein [Planctomycetota bacterium]